MYRRLLSVCGVALLLLAVSLPLSAEPVERDDSPSSLAAWASSLWELVVGMAKMGPHTDPGGESHDKYGPHTDPGGEPDPDAEFGTCIEPGGHNSDSDPLVDPDPDYGPHTDPGG